MIERDTIFEKKNPQDEEFLELRQLFAESYFATATEGTLTKDNVSNSEI